MNPKLDKFACSNIQYLKEVRGRESQLPSNVKYETEEELNGEGAMRSDSLALNVKFMVMGAYYACIAESLEDRDLAICTKA
ncbi:hypothetical protein Avbf_18484 [Armadillidium vulgare]|nr:hypothetical protein Avbf_18484 [Armadillidium vulgare]